MRISHVATRQLTDVHHATVVQADVNKSPKVNDVEDRTHEFHSHLKILQLEHALLKERLRQVLAGIPTWASELLDDVRQKQSAHAEFLGEGWQVEAGCLLCERFRPLTARQIFWNTAEPLQHF